MESIEASRSDGLASYDPLLYQYLRRSTVEGGDAMNSAPEPGVSTTGTAGGGGEEERRQEGGDELIIDCQKVELLRKNLDRIQTLLKVTVQFGIRAMEDTEKQWISITGSSEDRAMAKEYIKALCSPGEHLPLTFPEELHPLLSHPDIHARLERQSNTAILFPSVGTATIQGADTLAVTLAMSAIEDLILKYQDAPTSMPGSPNSISLESNERLDRELRRLSAQNKEMFDESFDEEALSALPSAVKRTILKCCIDDHYVEKGTKNDPIYLDKDQTVPMVIDITTTTPATDYFDLHQKKSSDLGSLSLPSDLGSDSPSSSLKSVEASSRGCASSGFVATKQAIPTDPENLKCEALTPSRQISDHMKMFALNKGYTEDEISAVEKDFGQTLSHAEFISALVMNRRAKTQIHAKTVAEIEASHLGVAPGQATANSSNVGATPSTPKQQSKEQPNHTPPHNQGPKMKKGKSLKSVEPKPAKKKSSRKSRWGPAGGTGSSQKDDRSSDQMDVGIMELPHKDIERPDPPDEVPHPFEVLLSQRNWRGPGSEKGSGEDKLGTEAGSVPTQVLEYLQQFKRDCNEEDCSNIDELRQRNAERQRILRDLLQSKQDEDVIIVGEETVNVEQPGDSRQRNSDKWETHSTESQQEKTKAGPSVPQGQHKESGHRGTLDTQPGPPRINRHSATAATATAAAAVTRADALDEISLSDMRNHKETLSEHRDPSRRPQHQLPANYTHHEMLYQPAPCAPTEMRSNPRPLPAQSHMAQSLHTATNSSHQQHPLPNRNLRYIVIDGSNVAMTHGNHNFFSCKGIRLCIDYFHNRGHTEITAFVPQWRTHAPRPDYPIRDQHLLEQMRQEGVLVFTPARRVPGKNIVCYDDKFVLRLAQETEGIIVSNDNYRDLWHEKREWRRLIEERLLMFSFVADIFMAPDDPLGRNGPDLDTFLRKSQVYEEAFNQKLWHHRQQPSQSGGDWHTRTRGNVQGQYGSGRGQAQFIQGHGRPIYGQQQEGWYGQGPNQAARMQQATVAASVDNHHRPNRPQGQGQRQRQDSMTMDLHNQLLLVFPDSREKVTKLLLQYPYETDLNKLSDHMLDAK